LIDRLQLLPHPEGGYYREVHRAKARVETPRGKRSAATAIYFLLPAGQASVLHRVRSDETWHFYEGAPLRLIDVTPQITRSTVHRLGNERGKMQQVVTIAADHWQAAESTGSYTLVGCTVAPGFDFADFTLLRHDSRAQKKLARNLPALRRFMG
jgi:predicted cupin superfamily sugar epimerase